MWIKMNIPPWKDYNGDSFLFYISEKKNSEEEHFYWLCYCISKRNLFSNVPYKHFIICVLQVVDIFEISFDFFYPHEYSYSPLMILFINISVFVYHMKSIYFIIQ